MVGIQKQFWLVLIRNSLGVVKRAIHGKQRQEIEVGQIKAAQYVLVEKFWQVSTI
jgi:hypothetical protein